MNFMLMLKQKINEIITSEFNISVPEFVVEHPQTEAFGDYATNVALILTRLVKQSPMEIAKRIGYKLESSEFLLSTNKGSVPFNVIFERLEIIAPGFINFKISQEWLLKLLIQNSDALNNYGVGKMDDVKRIALEHSNVNPNKAAHIGHLRNACIGQFIERAYEMQGFNVEVQYYANNAGVQVATSMMGIQKLKHYSPLNYEKFDHYAWDVYAEMESLIQSDENLQNERLNILKNLEDSNTEDSKLQRELANKILIEQLKTFSRLDFDYDVIIYESDILAKKLWEKAFEMLKQNPNVYFAEEGPSKGCWLVRLSDKPSNTASTEDIETDKIIVRSNGVATYTGKDIAYHMWKYGLLDVDFGYQKWDSGTQQKSLYVTSTEQKENITFSGVSSVFDVIGVEQTYAIDVVKKALGFLGYPEQAANMRHINYGFVFLSRDTASNLGIDVSDGKKFYAMSGRKGWGIKIDDLIKIVDDRLTQTYGSFDDVSVVRTGAIKFAMLKLNTFQDLIFDLEESLDIKGYSGTYIQYAGVRANSVLKKAFDFEPDFSNFDKLGQLDPKEISLIRQLNKFPEIVMKSSHDFAANILCDYLYETAKRFNTFYNDMPILNNSDQNIKNFRLQLCHSFVQILTQGLWLLGIKVPSKM